MIYRLGVVTVVFSAFIALAPVGPAFADDESSDAGTQLDQVEETSQEATVAPSEEDAKDLSGQGFDTPSTN
ncbi:MAG: hypothetical protein Q7S99_07365 [Parvibaculum sp.]|nr:hypothetical protein [Parvibaculum sp.]